MYYELPIKFILTQNAFNYLWSIFDISKTIRWYLLPIKYINRFTQRIWDRLTPFKLSSQPENTSIHFYLRYKIIPTLSSVSPIHSWPWAKHIFVQWNWLSYSERKTQKDEVNWIELILNDVKYNEYRRVRRRQWLLYVKYMGFGVLCVTLFNGIAFVASFLLASFVFEG